MFNLFILLLERVGLIIIIAYILMNINHFKTIMSAREKLRAQIELTILFSLFAIISNFTGIEIEHGKIISSNIYYHLNNETSLANTRVLTIGMSGLMVVLLWRLSLVLSRAYHESSLVAQMLILTYFHQSSLH